MKVLHSICGLVPRAPKMKGIKFKFNIIHKKIFTYISLSKCHFISIEMTGIFIPIAVLSSFTDRSPEGDGQRANIQKFLRCQVHLSCASQQRHSSQTVEEKRILKFQFTSSQDIGFYFFVFIKALTFLSFIHFKIFTSLFVSKNKSVCEWKCLEGKKIVTLFNQQHSEMKELPGSCFSALELPVQHDARMPLAVLLWHTGNVCNLLAGVVLNHLVTNSSFYHVNLNKSTT